MGLLVTVLIFKPLCCGCKRYPSLKSMNVFVTDEPGSFAEVLNVFQVSDDIHNIQHCPYNYNYYNIICPVMQ